MVAEDKGDGLLVVRHVAYFDDMAWPRAGEALGELEDSLRHGIENPTRPEILSAAFVLSAYRELVWCPRVKRERVIRRLREAEKRESQPCQE